MKIGFIVVLYNPEHDIIDKWKNEQKGSHYHFCVVDNSKEKNNHGFDYYIHNENAGGIAGALNKGINYLFEHGCDFIFTFDQDSILPKYFFEEMESFIVEKNAKMVCPNFYDINSKSYATFFLLKKWIYKKVNLKKEDITTFAISSGMGISRSAWETVGEFNEAYIIDHVDTEICLKAHVNNIPIYVNKNICLNHQIGNRETVDLFFLKLKPNNHNKYRKYYIVRNGTHLSFKYVSVCPSFFIFNSVKVAYEFFCVFFEKNKLAKFGAMARGLLHSITGTLGSYK
ncbi:glycosyltransferase [Affinibrenneria salicis]|uniref:glycosyltransferase n=1 Tax=Affinibrenneria salicis TaxID=2590031 RepID=UPI00168B21EB|nr:glycosyltransferase [Affinibrenneria salicis]